MKKTKYIIFFLIFLILAGCSDITNKAATKKTSPIDTVDNNTSSVDPSTNESEDVSDDAIVDNDTNKSKNIRERVVEKEDEEEIIAVETIPSNWYIRIVAEDQSRSLKTNLSQLGELEETNAVQNHTLVSGGRFSNPYLDVIFVDPDGMPAGDYKTNYHVYGEGIDDSWRFTVETDDVNAEIRLSWNGVYVLSPSQDAQNRIQYSEYRSGTNPLIAKMKLIDSSTGVEIPAMLNSKVQVHVFNMDGQVTRNFEWVVDYD